ncbi:aminotransferase class I/II-fold pyridoxal phosphate-dependent enzyme [Gloeothece verrucosa]|uniref:Aminotransferase class I and II n=1 Tax=Gloeothece verrucosa (strain PCC 7822) TaxID=497965 RepID=E0UNB0_GLOV7|nr:aminotransferase class I/II-fold pyridoxal phosphate-dependent enzyme [Gloeothece verrucosa]ADN18440.1 aminotransferase class I and II [Gloeothece verrucosa PCC 7822]
MKLENKNRFKVIILAAGYGRRMRPLTYHTHKTLLKIADKTVIQRIINSLLEFKITDINIVTGYQDAELKLYLKQTYPHLDFNYIYNPKYAETNNIYSLALAFENLKIDRDIILIEADLIFDSSILKHLLQSPHSNVALVDYYRLGMDGTVVTISTEKIITNVIPPHLQGSDFDFRDKYKTLNVYKFSQEFCANNFSKLLVFYAKTLDNNCYYEIILGLIIYLGKVEVYAELIQGKWAEIDDPNDLRIAEFVFNESIQQQILDASFGGFWNYDILDFCFLRNMYFPSNSLISEIKNNLTVLLQSYSSTQKMIDEKLSSYLYCESDYVITLNGASQIYPILEEYLKESKVLLPCPTFGEYPRIFKNCLTYSDQVGIDTNEILDKINDCNSVVIVNPNNPTGSVISTEFIYNLALTNPSKLIIVDESFINFSEEKSILELLKINPLNNVILLVSLSKILGIPGVRLGYIYCCNFELNNYIRHRISIWNLNSIAEFFLEIILKHRDMIQESYQKTKRDRHDFAEQLIRLPLVNQVYPSGANFLLVELDCETTFMAYLKEQLLKKYRIYIKDVSNRFTTSYSYLRLAVRNEEDNHKFSDSYLTVIKDYNIFKET